MAKKKPIQTPSKKQPKEFFHKTYLAKIILCIGWTEQEYAKFIKERFGLATDTRGYSGLATSIENEHGDAYYLIWTMYKHPWTVAHECFHMTNQIFKDRGIKPDAHNDEPQAYFLGELVKECLCE